MYPYFSIPFPASEAKRDELWLPSEKFSFCRSSPCFPSPPETSEGRFLNQGAKVKVVFSALHTKTPDQNASSFVISPERTSATVA